MTGYLLTVFDKYLDDLKIYTFHFWSCRFLLIHGDSVVFSKTLYNCMFDSCWATTIACIVVSYFFNGMRQQLGSIAISDAFWKVINNRGQLPGSESTSGLTGIVVLRKKEF